MRILLVRRVDLLIDRFRLLVAASSARAYGLRLFQLPSNSAASFCTAAWLKSPATIEFAGDRAVELVVELFDIVQRDLLHLGDLFVERRLILRVAVGERTQMPLQFLRRKLCPARVGTFSSARDPLTLYLIEIGSG